MNKKVLILGGTGMLGNALISILGKEDDFDITATYRKNHNNILKLVNIFPKIKWVEFNVEDPFFKLDLQNSYVINCIGVIKSYIKEQDMRSVTDTVLTNTIFPIQLVEAAAWNKGRVIQICTDCVYSGQIKTTSAYDENSLQDATDIYGKTKSLGEVISDYVLNLRCSIIGRELWHQASLLEWVLNKNNTEPIGGYPNHFWNGITTIAFARICRGLIQNESELSGTFHLIPDGSISKFGLLQLIDLYFDLGLNITVNNTAPYVNRILNTHKNMNSILWQMGGYNSIPSIPQLVKEMASYYKTDPFIELRPKLEKGI